MPNTAIPLPPRGAPAKRFLALALLALLPGCRTAPPATASVPAPVRAPMLVPAPSRMEMREGGPFLIGAATSIVAPSDSAGRVVAEGLARLLRPSTGFALP